MTNTSPIPAVPGRDRIRVALRVVAALGGVLFLLAFGGMFGFQLRGATPWAEVDSTMLAMTQVAVFAFAAAAIAGWALRSRRGRA